MQTIQNPLEGVIEVKPKRGRAVRVIMYEIMNPEPVLQVASIAE